MRERANYEVVTVSTVAAQTDTEVIGPGRPVRAFYVSNMTTTATVKIRLGRNGGLITLALVAGRAKGFEVPQGSPLLTSGIYLTGTADGAGASVEAVAVFDDEENSVRGQPFKIVFE